MAAAVLLCAPGDVNAGRRFSGWLSDTDVLPQRSAELEWWVWERTGQPPPVVYLAAAGVVGISDHLELALPLELGLRSDQPGQLALYGLDVRYRLASPDAAAAGPVVPLLRAGVRRLVQREDARLELDAVVSITAGKLRVVVNAGAFAETEAERIYAVGGAGVAYALTQDLAVGAELYAEASLFTPGEHERWISAGPTLAFTYGRFWVTGSLPIGLHDEAPDLLPRVQWGIMF